MALCQLLFIILSFFILTCSERNLNAQRTSLAQLPLEKLLHVKHELEAKEHEKGEGKEDHFEGNLKEENPQPLRTNWNQNKFGKEGEPNKRGDVWDEKGDKGKGDFSSLFQSSVTILSFLAFGGYLLCLLVSTIKGSGQAVGTTTTTMTTLTAPASATIIGKKRRKRAAEESMLRWLHVIAEAYAKYDLGQDGS